MDTPIADVVARTTREEAVRDARNDLRELSSRAVEAGRERSREIIKTSRIDRHTGVIRYNPAGRLLRDWYFHVYLNTLRRNLGEPAVIVDAQQVEDTTALLRRVQPSQGLTALRAVAVVRATAVDDAAHAAADIVDHLAGAAMRRAILHAPDHRFDGDQLAIHVTRHWYQHCYDDHIHGATRSRHPLADVTDAQQRQVVDTLAIGYARRVIGRDGVPLITAHGTALTLTDRQLAAGLTGVASPIADPDHHIDPGLRLSKRVTRTWADLGHDERALWLRAAHADHVRARNGWSELPGEIQSNIIRLYLDTHHPDRLATPFQKKRIHASPIEAARRMFNHQHPLLADSAPSKQDEPASRLRIDDHPNAIAVSSPPLRGMSG